MNKSRWTQTSFWMTGKRYEYSNAAETSQSKNMTIKNAAAKNGGAIHNWDDLSIEESVLSDNIAQEHGGAIYVSEKSKYESYSCTFTDNMPENEYED